MRNCNAVTVTKKNQLHIEIKAMICEKLSTMKCSRKWTNETSKLRTKFIHTKTEQLYALAYPSSQTTTS